MQALGEAQIAAYYSSSLLVRRHTLREAGAVTPRFPKYVETESRRESATYIREENTQRIHAKPKLT